jgi:predicted nucleotidyltransferase
MEKPMPLEHIRQVVAAYFADKPVRRVEVFGSYARGEATAESDLDLLLTMEQPVGFAYFKYVEDLEEILQLKVELGTVVSDYIRRYIQKDLRTIYEHSERQAA